jgi:Na+-driven multidrug efflux pump
MLGAGRGDRADALVFHAFLLALVIAAIFSTVMLLGAPFLFRSMGGRDEMLSDALAYANVALGRRDERQCGTHGRERGWWSHRDLLA